MNIMMRVGVAVLAVSVTGSILVAAPKADSSKLSATKTAGQHQSEWFKRASHNEQIYRNRVERLRALRDLAEERGNTRKVAKIDALFERLEAKYAEREAHLREVADRRDQARLDGQLAEWRQEHREQLHEKWVEHRADTDSRETRFDVFAPSGELLAYVRTPLPSSAAPYFRGDRIYLVSADSLDIQTVWALRVVERDR